MCKRVVAYCRVSTNGQVGEDKFGIDSQKRMITEYCNSHDMSVDQWYIDEGISGVKEVRPEFELLLDGRLKDSGIDTIICAKNDRIARDIKLYFYYKHILSREGIKLISVSEDFGELGAFAPMLETFVMFVAEQERMNITKRTSGGRKVKAAQGGYSGGKVPFGYKVIDGKLEIEERESNIVKEVFRLRDSGKTQVEIAKAMSGKTNRSGGKISISNVQKILEKRKFYQGYYKYSDMDWVKGKHKAIINE